MEYSFKQNYKLIIFLIFLFLSITVFDGKAEDQYRGDLWSLLNYYRIEAALNRYRLLEQDGGWPLLPYNIVLRKGDLSDDILILRERLSITGDLNDANNQNSSYFDEKLEEALKNFQYRHGLEEDGILGPQTINALNILLSEKIRRLEITQEEIYNLFDEYVKSYIFINIPAFELKVIEHGKEILDMRAIIGKTNSKTPIFKDKLKYLVFNPTWRIPIRKTVNEIIPRIKEDPSYLDRKNIRVFDSWDENAKEITPGQIDWDQYNLNNFDLMLEQDSGPNNELGNVKFMFPNNYLVYIHDTPNKDLFEYRVRTFSSGCIRIEKPIELALYCLKDQAGWDSDRIMKVLESGEIEQVNLVEHIPIVIVYWTAWVDENGIVYFRNDIYNFNR